MAENKNTVRGEPVEPQTDDVNKAVRGELVEPQTPKKDKQP